jgi:hypothetical protein
MCMRRQCHTASAMETCLRGTVTGGTAAGLHECSSKQGSARARFACSQATAQSASSRGVRRSHGGSAAVQHAVLSAPMRGSGSARMQRRRRIAPAASAATDAPPVAERLSGADAEQWSAAVEEVGRCLLHVVSRQMWLCRRIALFHSRPSMDCDFTPALQHQAVYTSQQLLIWPPTQHSDRLVASDRSSRR